MIDGEDRYREYVRKLFLMLIGLGVLMLVILFACTTGCVSYAKGKIMPTPEPTPVLTATTTPEPTEIETEVPTPLPTPDYGCYADNCHKLRDWVYWFRPDVMGNRSMRTWVTVYGYKFLPYFRYYSTSWGRYFRESPVESNTKYLFVYVNLYADDTNGAGDVRQWVFPQDAFTVQVKDKLYYATEYFDPTRRIKEMENVWAYDRATQIGPYGYKIVQEKGTGIYSAELLETLYAGRSNAVDGYIIFVVPSDANENNTKIHGSFANLGGFQMWTLNR